MTKSKFKPIWIVCALGALAISSGALADGTSYDSSSVQNGAQGTTDSAKNAASGATDTASDAAKNAKDSAADTATNAKDSASHAAQDAASKGSQSAATSSESAESAMTGAANEAKGKMENGATLTDAQITEIVISANNADIDAAKLAKSKSKDKRVKDMASHMITDHKASNKQVKGLSVKPKSSEASKDMKKDAKQAKSDLKGKKSADFDKAYVDHEVAFHEQVLQDLDNKLLPQAKSAEVKEMLTQTRPVIQQHLEHAKALQSSLNQKAGTAGTDRPEVPSDSSQASPNSGMGATGTSP